MNDRFAPEHLLPNCPQCQAWPMAISAKEFGRLTFRCPKCRAQASYAVGVGGRLVPVSEGAAVARGG
jgi:tRNA(Ile2) C34 agmatinyltransferase TiaS